MVCLLTCEAGWALSATTLQIQRKTAIKVDSWKLLLPLPASVLASPVAKCLVPHSSMAAAPWTDCWETPQDVFTEPASASKIAATQDVLWPVLLTHHGQWWPHGNGDSLQCPGKVPVLLSQKHDATGLR